MKSGSYIPDRGDIVWLNFTPQAGHEQKGKRPALVISPKIYNEKTSLCICVPITSKVKGYPFEVSLPKKLPIEGVILSDQVKNLDFMARDVTFICKLPNSVVQKVQKNILALVGDF
ncbi:endoribonuclease MazF [Hydrogenimonas thermophila]|uniref:mRNA interferase n=1 Tax=Hydrogenimonas thermophila TaxID=223786 RepID=A0A1I5LMH5_9BACT|nr:endoribonuclease MazF [Hydrogenimonas thermophila]SFO97971.1 transcriptional modulator of MazE/toxin, MazF [Hydrogenimonas thermophila]